MRNNSFGALRLFASLLVVYTHSFPIAMGSVFHEPLIGLPFSLGTVGVFIFFVISGILVSTSFVQSRSITHFLVYRAARIFPALIVCLLLCAVVIGPLVTKVALSEYFLSGQLWGFLLKNAFLLSNVQTTLPGVFTANPLPSAVNDPIWTLPWEIRAYVLLALGGVLFSVKRFQAAGSLLLVLVALNALFLMDVSKTSLLLVLFFLGSTLSLLKLRTEPALTLLGVLTLLIIMTHDTLMFDVFFCGWIAVLTYLVGFSRWGVSVYLEKYDLSYGLYIYSFPVAQSLVFVFGISNPWVLFVLNVTVAAMLAMLSWLYVEKPVLDRMRNIADKVSTLFRKCDMSDAP